MSIEMGYNLETEQSEIIGEAIKYYLLTKKGIMNFLRGKAHVIDLEDGIPIRDFRYSRDLKDREIGIKFLPIHKDFINIQRLTLIFD